MCPAVHLEQRERDRDGYTCSIGWKKNRFQDKMSHVSNLCLRSGIWDLVVET